MIMLVVSECTDKMFLWSDANIQSQLPLPPGGELCIALCLYAHSDFLLPPVTSPGKWVWGYVGGGGGGGQVEGGCR